MTRGGNNRKGKEKMVENDGAGRNPKRPRTSGIRIAEPDDSPVPSYRSEQAPPQYDIRTHGDGARALLCLRTLMGMMMRRRARTGTTRLKTPARRPRCEEMIVPSRWSPMGRSWN
ncbi:hypothetical protein LIER_42101 [Lithospermum erythrorhizon]|uniref:Uncharacterized protein n=1 Tax=Lithospermum erythrorhizon TaxID=34254 RepID=A0AAV3RK03_LITER